MAKIFENTTALAAATLTAGQMVSVKEVGSYRIKASGSGITLANSNVAVPVASGTAVNVLQWGADPTGVTDSTAAIQAAIDSGAGTVYVPKGSYKITDTIYITTNFNGEDADFLAAGSTITGAAIVVQANKTASTTALLLGAVIKLPSLTNSDQPVSGWAGQCDGIVLNNLDSCEVYAANFITGFSVGLKITSYGGGAGCAYNKIHIGRIVYNDTNLLLQPSDASGYVNENSIFGGKLGFTSTNLPTSLLSILPTSGQTNGPNGNKFYSPCVEGEAGGGTSPTYHMLVGGSFNVFIGTRFEFSGGNGKVVFWKEDSNDPTDNLFEGGYSYGNIAVSATSGVASPTNRFINVGRYQNIEGRFSPTYATVPVGGTTPYLRMYLNTKDLYSASVSDTDWASQIGVDGQFETKNPTFHTQTSAQLKDGYLQVNDGTAAIAGGPFITYVDASIGTTTSVLQAGSSGAWNSGHLKIGGHHLWVDGTGDLRIKFGAPSSDTDGTVVGTQT